MKKSENGKRKSQPKKVSRKENLSDMGLEPPKIYRDSQQNIVSRQERARKNNSSSRDRKNENITRAEKRQLDSKKRRRKNKIRKVLIGIGTALVFAAVGVVLSLTVFLRITDITVTGNERYTSEEIINQCTIDVGDNLFLADIENAKEKLELNLPYIYSANINRKLPYTIEITVKEAEPAYAIQNKDKTYILLDDKFKVLEQGSKDASGITISQAEIESVEIGKVIKFKDSNVEQCLNEIAQIIRDNKLTEITSIYSKGINENYVVYDKRIIFELGNNKNLENKIFQGLASCQKLDESNPNVEGTMDITGGKSIYFAEK